MPKPQTTSSAEKEKINKQIRQEIASGKSPEQVVEELREQGYQAELVKITFKKEEAPKEEPAQQAQQEQGIIAKAAEAVEKTVVEPVRQFLQKDIESRYGKDLTKLEYLQYEAGRKSIGEALQVYTSPIAGVATRFEAEGNPLVAGFFGFVEGGATMLAVPAVIGEQVIGKTREKGIFGTGEAVKDIVLGTIEWVAGIPGRIASGRPSEIGRVAGEVAAGAVAGKVMEAPLKVVGKTAEAIEFHGAEYIPLEKITQPEVIQKKVRFPFTREIIERGGRKIWGERATPETTVETTIRQFYETPAKEVTEVGRESPAAMWHASADVTPFKKESYTVRGAEKRSADVAGQYGAPEASIRFLRLIPEYETFNPLTALKSAIETVKERGITELIKSEIRETFGMPTKAGLLHIGLEGVKRVPEEFRGSFSEIKEFFRTAVEKGIAEKGYAYIEGKTEFYKITGEAQAVIPHGAVVERFPGKKYYTVVEGRKVPIYQFKYRGELRDALKEVREAARTEPARTGERMTFEEASKKYSYPTPYRRFGYRPVYYGYEVPTGRLYDVYRSLEGVRLYELGERFYTPKYTEPKYTEPKITKLVYGGEGYGGYGGGGEWSGYGGGGGWTGYSGEKYSGEEVFFSGKYTGTGSTITSEIFRLPKFKDLELLEPNIDLMRTYRKNPVGELLFGKLRL